MPQPSSMWLQIEICCCASKYSKTIAKIEFAINFKLSSISIDRLRETQEIQWILILFHPFLVLPFFIVFFLIRGEKLLSFFYKKKHTKCNKYVEFSRQQYEHISDKMVRTSTRAKKSLRVLFEKCLPRKIVNLGICVWWGTNERASQTFLCQNCH